MNFDELSLAAAHTIRNLIFAVFVQ